jgi:hypothetical protein
MYFFPSARLFWSALLCVSVPLKVPQSLRPFMTTSSVFPMPVNTVLLFIRQVTFLSLAASGKVTKSDKVIGHFADEV